MEYKVFLTSQTGLRSHWMNKGVPIQESEALSKELTALANEGWSICQVLATPIVTQIVTPTVTDLSVNPNDTSNGLAQPASTFIETMLLTVVMQREGSPSQKTS